MNDARDDKGQEHPSFGMIGIGRWQGGGSRLFGSPVPVHHGIRLTISKARLYFDDLHQQRIYGTDAIIEVDMTPAQFADLIASAGEHGGPPCTISYTRDVGRVEPPPKTILTEPEQIYQDFENAAAEFGERFDKAETKIKAILAKPSIGKGDREDIMKELGFVRAHAENGLPFLVQQLQKTVSRVVTSAKHEVKSFADAALRAAGLEHLKGKALLEDKTKLPCLHKGYNVMCPNCAGGNSI